jgi:hypothetical protein
LLTRNASDSQRNIGRRTREMMVLVSGLLLTTESVGWVRSRAGKLKAGATVKISNPSTGQMENLAWATIDADRSAKAAKLKLEMTIEKAMMVTLRELFFLFLKR